MNAREEILARIRATTRTASPPVTREYRRTGTLTAGERVDRFCERAADYRADVTRVAAGEISDAVGRAVATRGARRIGLPPDVPPSWIGPDVDAVVDRGLTARELDRLDGVLTGCTVAIAETGTIVLAGGPAEGRRALTLVPDLHICVVRESQIVAIVPEAIAFLADLASVTGSPLTLISGPSATSDIELSRVEGVHGPRTLCVLVVSEEPS